MKRLSLVAVILMAAVIGLIPALAAGETSFFSSGSIIRLYTDGGPTAAAPNNPYNLWIEAVDTTNQHLTGASFTCGALSGNPVTIATDCTDDVSVSMAFDATQKQAYIFYSNGQSQFLTCSLSGAGGGGGGGGTGSPDLTTTWTWTCPAGTVGSCVANTINFTMTVTVKNQGSGDAGPFNVKGFINPAGTTAVPTFGGTTLFSWDLSGLAAGASQTQTFPVHFTGLGIHVYYWFGVMVDTANTVAESNETNNIKAVKVMLYR